MQTDCPAWTLFSLFTQLDEKSFWAHFWFCRLKFWTYFSYHMKIEGQAVTVWMSNCVREYFLNSFLVQQKIFEWFNVITKNYFSCQNELKMDLKWLKSLVALTHAHRPNSNNRNLWTNDNFHNSVEPFRKLWPIFPTSIFFILIMTNAFILHQTSHWNTFVCLFVCIRKLILTIDLKW